EYSSNLVPLDPYFLGILLGDGGLKRGIVITSSEPEIIKEVYKQSNKYSSRVRFEAIEDNKSDNYFILGEQVLYKGTVGPRSTCKIRKILRDLNLYGRGSGEKFVPREYKTGSIGTRLSIIAGMLDTDGSLDKNCYEWSSKSRQLAEDMCFMVRSVG